MNDEADCRTAPATLGLLIKVEVETLENATKEGIYQLRATVQHLSEKMLNIETKLAHPDKDPVVEVEVVEKKVKHTHS